MEYLLSSFIDMISILIFYCLFSLWNSFTKTFDRVSHAFTLCTVLQKLLLPRKYVHTLFHKLHLFTLLFWFCHFFLYEEKEKQWIQTSLQRVEESKNPIYIRHDNFLFCSVVPFVSPFFYQTMKNIMQKVKSSMKYITMYVIGRFMSSFQFRPKCVEI